MSATFSPCGRYRYNFVKRWRPGPLMVVVGHNPSRAGQVKCPACTNVIVPRPGAQLRCLDCGNQWTPPGDGSDEIQDPTVLKCSMWARRDGFAGLMMLNLCAAISTDPDGLTLMEDPVGPETDDHLLRHVPEAGRVVAAWGGLAAKSRSQLVRGRPVQVLRKLAPLVDLWAFRLSVDRTPWHPLYLPNKTEAFLWRERDRCSNGDGRQRHGPDDFCLACLEQAAEKSKRMGFV